MNKMLHSAFREGKRTLSGSGAAGRRVRRAASATAAAPRVHSRQKADDFDPECRSVSEALRL